MSSCRYLRRRRDQKGPSFTYEVIIVDDGSRDATVRVAFDYVRAQGIDSMRVLQLPRNYGKVRPGAPAGLSVSSGGARFALEGTGSFARRLCHSC